MLKVGVIDTGVNVDQLEIDSSRVKGIHLFKDTSTGEIQAGYDLHDDLLHGTVCLHILHSCGADIEFFVVKIFDTVAQASVDILVRAIEECIAQNVNVINISLGIQTEKMPFTLQKACDKARSRGILIVAAAHNNSLISYPAHSPSVIGVGHLLLEKDSQIVHFRDYPIDFFLTGMHFFRGSIFSGSSFACPKLTGIVLKLLADSAGRVNGDIKEALRQISKHLTVAPCFNHNKIPASSIEVENEVLSLKHLNLFEFLARIGTRKAILLPMHDAAYDYTEGMSFPIATDEITIDRLKVRYTLEHLPVLFEKPEDLNQFDTVILGTLRSILSIFNCEYIVRQLTDLLSQEKSFLVFDDYSYKALYPLARKSGRENSLHLYRGSSHRISETSTALSSVKVKLAPVLAVLGVSIEDLVSYQLKILHMTRSAGTSAVYIAPTAQAELGGAHFSLHFSVTEEECLSLREQSERAANVFKFAQLRLVPDLLITGPSKGMVLQQAAGGTAFAESIGLLSVIPPDAAVMVIDFRTDSQEKILHLIHLIEGLIGTTIICFLLVADSTCKENRHFLSELESIAPVVYANDWQTTSALKYLIDCHLLKHSINTT